MVLYDSDFQSIHIRKHVVIYAGLVRNCLNKWHLRPMQTVATNRATSYYIFLFYVQAIETTRSFTRSPSKNRFHSPSRSGHQIQNYINKQPLKVTPTKTLQHMPGKVFILILNTDYNSQSITRQCMIFICVKLLPCSLVCGER